MTASCDQIIVLTLLTGCVFSAFVSVSSTASREMLSTESDFFSVPDLCRKRDCPSDGRKPTDVAESGGGSEACSPPSAPLSCASLPL